MTKPVKQPVDQNHPNTKLNPVSAQMNRAMRREISRNKDYIESRWDELNDLYTSMAHGIYDTASNVQIAIASVGRASIKDNEANIAIEGLNKDIDSFTTQLLDLKKTHADKTGVVKDGNELAAFIEIAELYTDFELRFRAVTLPTVLVIMDHVGRVVNEMKKQVEAEEAAKAAAQPTEENPGEAGTPAE